VALHVTDGLRPRGVGAGQLLRGVGDDVEQRGAVDNSINDLRKEYPPRAA
jgi:hypothetical protein